MIEAGVVKEGTPICVPSREVSSFSISFSKFTYSCISCHLRTLHLITSNHHSVSLTKICHLFLYSWDSTSLIHSSKTNKMQRYTMVFITINVLHVSGGSSAHHQELKTVYTASGMCQAFNASYRYVSELELVCVCCCSNNNSLMIAVRSRKLDKYPMLCIQF